MPGNSLFPFYAFFFSFSYTDVFLSGAKYNRKQIVSCGSFPFDHFNAYVVNCTHQIPMCYLCHEANASKSDLDSFMFEKKSRIVRLNKTCFRYACLSRFKSILHGSSSTYFFSSKIRLMMGFSTSCR